MVAVNFSILSAQAQTWEDIVIDGQSIREKFEQSLDQGKSILDEGVPIVIESREDLVKIAEFLPIADENIQKIEIIDDAIVLSYQAEAKLFALIPLMYDLRISVSLADDLQAKISAPWWLFLATDDKGALVEQVQSALDGFIPPPETDQDVSLRHKVLLTIIKAFNPLGEAQN